MNRFTCVGNSPDKRFYSDCKTKNNRDVADVSHTLCIDGFSGHVCCRASFQRSHERDLREQQPIAAGLCKHRGLWSMAHVFFGTFMLAVWELTALYCCRPHFETLDLGKREDKRKGRQNKSWAWQEVLLPRPSMVLPAPVCCFQLDEGQFSLFHGFIIIVRLSGSSRGGKITIISIWLLLIINS